MRRVVLLLLICATPAAAQPTTPRYSSAGLREELVRSFLAVGAYDAAGRLYALGAGVIVDREAEHYVAISAAHIADSKTRELHVKPVHNLRLGEPEAPEFRCALLALDRESDLMLLGFTVDSPRPVKLAVAPLAAAPPEPGEPLIHLGRPAVYKTMEVKVMRTAAGATENGQLHITGDPISGDSGGPIFNARGEVVGLVTGYPGRGPYDRHGPGHGPGVPAIEQLLSCPGGRCPLPNWRPFEKFRKRWQERREQWRRGREPGDTPQGARPGEPLKPLPEGPWSERRRDPGGMIDVPPPNVQPPARGTQPDPPAPSEAQPERADSVEDARPAAFDRLGRRLGQWGDAALDHLPLLLLLLGGGGAGALVLRAAGPPAVRGVRRIWDWSGRVGRSGGGSTQGGNATKSSREPKAKCGGGGHDSPQPAAEQSPQRKGARPEQLVKLKSLPSPPDDYAKMHFHHYAYRDLPGMVEEYNAYLDALAALERGEIELPPDVDGRQIAREVRRYALRDFRVHGVEHIETDRNEYHKALFAHSVRRWLDQLHQGTFSGEGFEGSRPEVAERIEDWVNERFFSGSSKSDRVEPVAA